MEKIRSWFYKGSDHNSDLLVSQTECKVAAEMKDVHKTENNNHTHVQVKKKVDQKVVEYFKDFPEPYRTKAIDRFSAKEGLYKWDFYRDLAMRREFQSGMRGNFLEDKREITRKIEEQEKIHREKVMDEAREVNKNRDLPDWQKAIQSKIPVHDDETLGLKIFQAANFSILGVLVLYAGVTLRKRRPNLATWQYYSTIVGSSYFCGYLQVAAVYRIYDWGPFDRSVDSRDAWTKTTDEMKQYFSSFSDDLLKGKNES